MSDWNWSNSGLGPSEEGFADRRPFQGTAPFTGPEPTSASITAYVNSFRKDRGTPGGTPTSSPPSPPSSPYYSGDDAFSRYLRDNPGAGDALAYLQSVLDSYRLGSLTSWVKDNIVQGRSNNEVIQRLRETNEYKTRFKAIIERQKRGMAPISEAEQVSLERAYAQNRRAAGLPAGFYDSPDDFYENIVNDISAAEDQSRILEGYVKYQQSPAEVRAEFERLGFGPGDQVAYWLDPSRAEPLLQQRLAAATISGTAVRAGYGGLTQGEALDLSNKGLSASQAQEGFSTLADQAGLFNALPGESTRGDITREQQLGTLSGNASAQQAFERRRASRNAHFQGGGGYGTSREGFSGAGSSQR